MSCFILYLYFLFLRMLRLWKKLKIWMTGSCNLRHHLLCFLIQVFFIKGDKHNKDNNLPFVLYLQSISFLWLFTVHLEDKRWIVPAVGYFANLIFCNISFSDFSCSFMKEETTDCLFQKLCHVPKQWKR